MTSIPRLDPELRSNPKQAFIGVLLYDSNLSTNERCQIEICLNQIFYYYQTFDNIERFMSYFGRERHVARIFLIISVSDSSLNALVNLCREHSQVKEVYVFSSLLPSTSTRSQTNNVNQLFQTIQNDIRGFQERTNPSGSTPAERVDVHKPFHVSRANQITTLIDKFIAKSAHPPPNAPTKDDTVQFFKFLTLIKLLLSLPGDSRGMEDMWQAFRDIYPTGHGERWKIDGLPQKYNAESTIEYYTESSSVFRIVNLACRAENVQQLYQFRVYINDLHKELYKRSQRQKEEGIIASIDKVYRGQILSACVLQQLIDSERKLILMNGFLSTTKLEEVSNVFSDVQARSLRGESSVRFKLIIDRIEQPFADISEISAVVDEDEVLFSVGSIWHITAIKFNDNVYEIELRSCADLDPQVEMLVTNYRQHDFNLSTIGDFLQDLGNYDEAKWFYEEMLKQGDLSVQIRVQLYYNIAMMERKLGHHDLAFSALQKAASLLEPSKSKPNPRKSPREIYKNDASSTLVAMYNNMGLIHEKKNAFDQARDCYLQALEVSHGSSTEKAIVNNNLGLLYVRYGSHEQALTHFAMAVELMLNDLSYWAEFKTNLDDIESVLST